jgi:hypothetical protein
MNPNTEDMTPVSDLTDEEELELAKDASDFISAFRWCSSVKQSFLAFDIGYPLGVFLFHIEPRFLGVDDTLWVIVGDGPPAFLVCDDAPDWHTALQCYVREMQQWVDAVLADESLDGIIPVNVAPTVEHAQMLLSRLTFIKEEIIEK